MTAPPAFSPSGTSQYRAERLRRGLPSARNTGGKSSILALRSDAPLSLVPTTDTIGHGTAIASIIAGKPDLEQSFSGVVPESELVVVKLKEAKQNLKEIFFVPEDAVCFQESDIMLGVRYLESYSQSASRPLVVCVAMGSSQGGHDGSGALSNYLNYFTRLPGIGVCVSAGNEGNSQRHYFKQHHFRSLLPRF